MYLIIGANGFLGSYILKNILEHTPDEIIAVARNVENVIHNPRIKWRSCDISNKKAVDALCEEINDLEKKVIFLAAYHNPDLVEKNPKFAWNINVTSLSYFVNRLSNVKCLFYPSTDSVYGNSVNEYCFKEEDQLNPVNTYGKQKCAAESVIRWYGYNVVRYPFLIAKSLSPEKKHFYDIIVEHLQNNIPIDMFVDSLRSSLSFDTAAELLIRLMENYSEKIPKILNICGDDKLSKYDVGVKIANKLGYDRKFIIPVSTSSSAGIFEATRAQTTLMDNTKVKKILGLDNIKLVL